MPKSRTIAVKAVTRASGSESTESHSQNIPNSISNTTLNTWSVIYGLLFPVDLSIASSMYHD